MTLNTPGRTFAPGDATTLSLEVPIAVLADSQFPSTADDTTRSPITIENEPHRTSLVAEHADAEPGT